VAIAIIRRARLWFGGIFLLPPFAVLTRPYFCLSSAMKKNNFS